MSIYKDYFKKSLENRKHVLTEGVDDDLEDAVTNNTDIDDLDADAKGLDAEDSSIEKDLGDEVDSMNDEVNKEGDETNTLFTQMKDQIAQSIEQSELLLTDWADKVHDFLSYINDSNREDSIKYALDNAPEGSPIDTIKTTIVNQFTRIASQLAALEQLLRAQVGNVSVNDVMNKNTK